MSIFACLHSYFLEHGRSGKVEEKEIKFPSFFVYFFVFPKQLSYL